jgi:hypothetical protein
VFLYIDNDHNLRLAGLRNEATWAFINDATVTCTLYNGLDATRTEITGQSWPLTMAYVDPTTDTVGGDATTPTTITSVSGFDFTVTVGANTALDLSAGQLVEVLHDEGNKWKVVRDVAGNAAATGVVVHVEPFIWTTEGEPWAVTATTGELLLLTDGTYKGVLDETLVITKGQKVYAEILVDAATEGVKGRFDLTLKGQYRLTS